ncbi:hypothetical protein BJY01DRAFT_150621 [Aspergillus pseudoustus]|uniref:Uncharacterized protein n=1 Tax=Aspergillus pseudoustus TaxID=1810923 RepID=A0ABR4IEK0_9EURO
MADLEYVDDLWMIRLDELETFSVPKLASAGSVTLDIGSHLDTLEMPVLEQVEYLDLKGNFTKVSFGELRNVDHDLNVANRRYFDPSVEAETTMNVSFPKLNSSESIFIIGRASSVSLPELTHLSDPWVVPYPGGSNFSLWGEAVSLDLPNLATVDGSITFEGNISSLSLPSLDNVQGNLTIIAGDSLSIDIPELGYAEVIRLAGQIESVELPGLVNWYELHVDTDLIFDCDAFMEEYDRVPAKRVVTCQSGSGTVEESDENNEVTSQDESSNEDSGDDTAGEQDGGDNGSARLNGRGMGAMMAASLAVAGLIALV